MDEKETASGRWGNIEVGTSKWSGATLFVTRIRFLSEDIVVAEVDEYLTQATFGLLLTDGQVDGADAEQDGQQQRLFVLAFEVVFRVLELGFDIDTQGFGSLRQLAPVDVEDVLCHRLARGPGHGGDHQQSDVVGRPTVRHHLPIQDRTLRFYLNLKKKK